MLNEDEMATVLTLYWTYHGIFDHQTSDDGAMGIPPWSEASTLCCPSILWKIHRKGHA